MTRQSTTSFCYCWRSVEQVAKRNFKAPGQTLNNLDRRITAGTFKVADVGAMDVGLVRELFLRPVAGLPKTAQISGKAIMNIHALQMRMMSTINLQTISDITT